MKQNTNNTVESIIRNIQITSDGECLLYKGCYLNDAECQLTNDINSKLQESNEKYLKGLVEFAHTDIHFPEEIEFAQRLKDLVKQYNKLNGGKL